MSLDYGIDEEVEIFGDEGEPTGLKFGVQLKATDAETESALRLRFDEAKIQYYRSLPDPVLLARYVSPTDTLYVRWVHSHDPYYEPADENGRTYVFGAEHEWDTETAGQLRRDVETFRRFRSASLTLPLEVHVLDSAEEVHGRSGAEWAAATREAAAPIADVVDVRGEAGAEGQATITFRDDAVLVSVGGVASVTFHHDEDLSAEDIALLRFDALVGLAVALRQLGHANVAVRILRAVASRSRVALAPDAAFLVVGCFGEARRITDALDVASALLDRDEGEAGVAAQIFTLPALEAGARMTGDERDAFERFSLRRIELAGEGEGLGQAHYSLANHLRTSGSARESFSHYRLAAKHDPAYRERAYFWREVGSVMFLDGRFESSVAALSRAVEFGDTPPTLALLGEALMFAGRFAEAEEAFAAYVERTPPGKADARLRQAVLPLLRQEYGDVVHRRIDDALRIVDDGDEGDLDALTAALQADPLCGLAWFNLGVGLAGTGRGDEAFLAFVMAGLCQPWDVEAWCNSIAVGSGVGDLPLLSLVVEAAYRLTGDQLLVEFGQLLRAQPDGPASPEILQALTDAVADLPRDEDLFELRWVESGNPEVAALVFDRNQPPL